MSSQVFEFVDRVKSSMDRISLSFLLLSHDDLRLTGDVIFPLQMYVEYCKVLHQNHLHQGLERLLGFVRSCLHGGLSRWRLVFRD